MKKKRKKPEGTPRESEAKYRSLVEAIVDAVIMTDTNGNILMINDAAEVLLGKSVETIKGKNLKDVLPQKMANSWLASIKKAAKTKLTTLLVDQKKEQYLETMFSPIRTSKGKIRNLTIVSRDITDRKLDEDQILLSKETYRELFNNMSNGVAVYEAIDDGNDFVFKDFNQAGEIIEKVKKKDIIGRRITEVFPGVKKFGLFEVLQRVWKTGKPEYKPASFYQDQRIAGWRENYVYKLPSGEIVVVYDDITERKQAEEALRTSEQYYHTLFDSSPTAIILEDPEGNFIDANQAFCSLTGFSRPEIIGENIQKVSLPSVPDEKEEYITRILSGETLHHVVKNVKKNGTRISVELHETKITLPNGKNAILIFANDITKLSQAEEALSKSEKQLRVLQKMEAIGRLASGVAHDFNNLLMAILAYSGLAREQLGENHPASKDIREIEEAAKRGGNLTRQLLAFSCKLVLKPTTLDLNKIVVDAQKMFRHIIGEDVRIKTILEPNIHRIIADQGQIEQIIMNLAINARGAMPEGGTLTLKTENIMIDKDSVEEKLEASAGTFACLIVEDTGAGMSEDTIEHIFEPFFTTKMPGEGTGLGLSTTYGIIKQHNGWISVYSEPGQGTTFRVYLPAVPLPAEAPSPEKSLITDLQGQGERILLVEDAKWVRESSSRALRQNGYEVFAVANAKEAMEFLEKEKGEIDLVFTDMILPDRSGLSLVKILLSRRPGLKVLLSSGYTDLRKYDQTIRERGFAFLQKPYPITKLLRTIKKVFGPGSNVPPLDEPGRKENVIKI